MSCNVARGAGGDVTDIGGVVVVAAAANATHTAAAAAATASNAIHLVPVRIGDGAL